MVRSNKLILMSLDDYTSETSTITHLVVDSHNAYKRIPRELTATEEEEDVHADAVNAAAAAAADDDDKEEEESNSSLQHPGVKICADSQSFG